MSWTLRDAIVPLELALLFAATLNREKWSIAAVFALLAWEGLRWSARPVVDVAFATRLGVLVLFCASFFIIASSFGLYGGFVDPAKFFVVIVGLYVAGYSAGREAPSIQAWKLLALVGGFTTFAFLSVQGAQSRGLFALAELADREAPSAWSPIASIGGTGLGALASLAMCLLPAAFARAPSGAHAIVSASWRGLVVLLAVLGFFTNIALQNRTPIFAFVGSVAATGVLMAYVKRASVPRRVAAAAILAVLVALAVKAGEILRALAPEYGLAERFMERGVETERYGAWLAVLASLPRHPFGGRMADLGGLNYAHNLWLDIAVDAGALPALLLLAFQASHLPAIKRVVRSAAPSPVRVALVGLGVSFLATFAVEPAMQFSIVYVAASGYALGMASAISARSEVVDAEP
ncbi:hypothetical protein [Anaeromyxobacter sp. Fw109-5]|uniref:hypothetical protein n=1 Tax=Anaeromyxobacter sp. (strain Fw109-5) TaxID=404589 RepID=UPI000158A68D|nr:hypothetical protein [Anaeromyxobacter sp. Fw109-5]ABS25442.1 hypothetical protein Anae109_1234 [Anaeromyxobacter sp. Fw109-5]